MHSLSLSAFGRLAQIMSHMVCSDEQPCTKLASENKLQLFHFRAGLHCIEDPKCVCLFQSEVQVKSNVKHNYMDKALIQSS